MNKKNFKQQDKIIKKSIETLKKNGLLIFPSDTVYGLLADATCERAVEKLIDFKNRPPGKPISVFVSDFSMLKDYVEVDDRQEKILKELLPGPFTVVLTSKHKVCQLLESEKGTLGVRLPDYSLIIELVKIFGKPITATSANLSGRPPHYQVETLLKQLPQSKKQLIDYIVDIGKLPRNKPSTIIDLTTPTIKVIRQGDIVFKDEKTYLSSSPRQTVKLGRYLLQRFLKEKEEKPLVFIIEGELGVGKTVLIKGMAEVLGIKNIISPTFVIYYQYGNFYHFDLYQIEEGEEFRYLKIEDLLKPGNILCIEWGEKAGAIADILKNKAKIIFIKIRYINEKKREIEVKS
ncbi:MAG: L-threonylcarbamoyladenylate synthase [Microgenomates group bacterium]